MAIVSMSDAVAGQPAQSGEYNKLIDNIEDLDTRVNAATSTNASQATAISTLESRTTNATTGNTQLGSRVTALEALKLPGSSLGSWTDNNGGSGITITNTGDTSVGARGAKMTDIGTALGTPSGCSMSAGTFTANQAGLWMFNYSMQTIGGSGNTGARAIFLATGNAASYSSGVRYGLTASNVESTALSTSATIRLTAGQQVSAYFAIWTASSGTTIWKAQGNLLTATWVGP